jgi:hypothetical protein
MAEADNNRNDVTLDLDQISAATADQVTNLLLSLIAFQIFRKYQGLKSLSNLLPSGQLIN